jgi:two-component system sensor histidine kinase CpxA
MRSVYTRILVWALLTLLLSMGMFFFISRHLEMQFGLGETVHRLLVLQLRQTGEAYETGGRERARALIDEGRKTLGWNYSVLDSAGIDLATGEDRSSLVRLLGGAWDRPVSTPEGFLFGLRSQDHRYVMISVISLPFDPREIFPYYGLILLTVAALCWPMAWHIYSPLRSLARKLDRFGQGDLAVRAGSSRRDEIGEIARSFDRMADRIETLLTAERRLLQDVSHELRSPLARLGFAAALLNTEPDREKSSSRIRREIDRLSALVGSLLEMTRAEGDPASRRRHSFRLDALVREVVNDCSVEAAARSCEISIPHADAVILNGDDELLRRAVENVVRNAVRYSPEGAIVEIRVSWTAGTSLITIRDHGGGVPEEQLSRIFQPFFRVDDARNSSTGGIGLGLAIAARAVSLHRGRIEAKNANPGLLVTISLPDAIYIDAAQTQSRVSLTS